MLSVLYCCVCVFGFCGKVFSFFLVFFFFFMYFIVFCFFNYIVFFKIICFFFFFVCLSTFLYDVKCF